MPRHATITLRSATTPEQVLTIARSTLEGRGYFWEPTGPTSASAHEGGKPVARKNLSSKLVVDLDTDGAQLTVTQRTTGAVGFLANLGLLVAMRVTAEFGKIRKALDATLG